MSTKYFYKGELQILSGKPARHVNCYDSRGNPPSYDFHLSRNTTKNLSVAPNW